MNNSLDNIDINNSEEVIKAITSSGKFDINKFNEVAEIIKKQRKKEIEDRDNERIKAMNEANTKLLETNKINTPYLNFFTNFYNAIPTLIVKIITLKFSDIYNSEYLMLDLGIFLIFFSIILYIFFDKK